MKNERESTVLALNCEFNGITLVFEKATRHQRLAKRNSFIRNTVNLSRNPLKRLPPPSFKGLPSSSMTLASSFSFQCPTLSVCGIFSFTDPQWPLIYSFPVRRPLYIIWKTFPDLHSRKHLIVPRVPRDLNIFMAFNELLSFYI